MAHSSMEFPPEEPSPTTDIAEEVTELTEGEQKRLLELITLVMSGPATEVLGHNDEMLLRMHGSENELWAATHNGWLKKLN